MKIGGWKTVSVFKRYAITNHSDTERAVRQLEANRERRKSEGSEVSQDSYRVAREVVQDDENTPIVPLRAQRAN